jgi:hypothetical protein
MKVIAILALIGGLLMSVWGIWLRRQSGGPMLVGNVTPQARALYGVTEAPSWPIAFGVVVALVGLVLLFV